MTCRTSTTCMQKDTFPVPHNSGIWYCTTAIKNWSALTSTNPVPFASKRSQICCNQQRQNHNHCCWRGLAHFEMKQVSRVDNKTSGDLRRLQWVAPGEGIQNDSNHKIQDAESCHNLSQRVQRLNAKWVAECAVPDYCSFLCHSNCVSQIWITWKSMKNRHAEG